MGNTPTRYCEGLTAIGQDTWETDAHVCPSGFELLSDTSGIKCEAEECTHAECCAVQCSNTICQDHPFRNESQPFASPNEPFCKNVRNEPAVSVNECIPSTCCTSVPNTCTEYISVNGCPSGLDPNPSDELMESPEGCCIPGLATCADFHAAYNCRGMDIPVNDSATCASTVASSCDADVCCVAMEPSYDNPNVDYDYFAHKIASGKLSARNELLMYTNTRGNTERERVEKCRLACAFKDIHGVESGRWSEFGTASTFILEGSTCSCHNDMVMGDDLKKIFTVLNTSYYAVPLVTLTLLHNVSWTRLNTANAIPAVNNWYTRQVQVRTGGVLPVSQSINRHLWGHSSNSKPYEMCQGPCSQDSDCDGELVCQDHPWSWTTDARGCEGHGQRLAADGGNFQSRFRVCEWPNNDFKRYSVCSTTYYRDHECKKDDHCEGDLKCFHRRSDVRVPGCTPVPSGGYGAFNNVCYDDTGAPEGSLGLCEGECFTDDDCAGHLACFKGNIGSGCKGSMTSLYHCYDPTFVALRPPEGSLGLCEGECFHDDDCTGNLICSFQRSSGEPAPGCDGNDESDILNYCYDPVLTAARVSPGTLGICEGECLYDDDCTGALMCFQGNMGTAPGCEGIPEGIKNHCHDPNWYLAPQNPLGLCEGVCLRDEDCAGTLSCFQASAGEYVPGCNGLNNAANYCYEPDLNKHVFKTEVDHPMFQSYRLVPFERRRISTIYDRVRETTVTFPLAFSNSNANIRPEGGVYCLELSEGKCVKWFRLFNETNHQQLNTTCVSGPHSTCLKCSATQCLEMLCDNGYSNPNGISEDGCETSCYSNCLVCGQSNPFTCIQEKCVSGQAFSRFAKTCKYCTPGFAGTTGRCSACKAGKYQDESGRVACKLCEVGKFSEKTTRFTPCTDCPSGKVNPSEGQLTCVDCSRGKHEVSGSCVVCPAGTYALSTTGCRPCSDFEMVKPGKYRSEVGSELCFECPSGNTMVDNECYECPPGRFLQDNDCSTCPSGWSQSLSGKTGCGKCPDATFSTEGSRTCKCFGDQAKCDEKLQLMPQRVLFEKIQGLLLANTDMIEPFLNVLNTKCLEDITRQPQECSTCVNSEGSDMKCLLTVSKSGLDSDGDGVPDYRDLWPNDPSRSIDSDGDGTANSEDAFPYDPTRSVDTDEDGVEDWRDAFPNDPSEQYDSDADGVGDNADVFPDDPTRSVDTDGDGVEDWRIVQGVNQTMDAFPNNSNLTYTCQCDNGDAEVGFRLDGLCPYLTDKCTSCNDGHWFTPAFACQAISTCAADEYVSVPATLTSDHTCVSCGAGYWLDSDHCVRHATCPVGQGVSTFGTGTEDTVCEACVGADFEFSDVDDYSTCGQHTKCPVGQGVLSVGTGTEDTVCEACVVGTNFSPGESYDACQAVSTSCAADEYVSVPATLTSDLTCATKVCTCSNGVAAQASDCNVHNTEQCVSCGAVYWLDSDHCVRHKHCSHDEGVWTAGTGTTDTVCKQCILGTNFSPGESYEACQAVSTSCAADEYVSVPATLTSDLTCATKVCTCYGGTGATGTDCPTHNTEQCVSCWAGGDVYEESPGFFVRDTGWWLDSGHCKMHVSCPVGQGVSTFGTGTEDTVCEACVGADFKFSDVDDYSTCGQHTKCPAGQGVVSNRTGVSQTTCSACIVGISFSPDESYDACQTVSTCPVGEYMSVTGTCATTVCTCPNGVSVQASECNVHNTEQCVSCDAGYWMGSDHTCRVDAFPYDPTERADLDSDGVGDNDDPWPSNPAQPLSSAYGDSKSSISTLLMSIPVKIGLSRIVASKSVPVSPSRARYKLYKKNHKCTHYVSPTGHGNEPELLVTGDAGYSPDRIEECMNRCLASTSTSQIRFFVHKHSSFKCMCALNKCHDVSLQTSNVEYDIYEADTPYESLQTNSRCSNAQPTLQMLGTCTAQECMNACVEDYAMTTAFYVTSGVCFCATDACSTRTSDVLATSYQIKATLTDYVNFPSYTSDDIFGAKHGYRRCVVSSQASPFRPPNVDLTLSGVKSCLQKCKDEGYTYGGFECPGVSIDKVHCQCSHDLDELGTTAPDAECAGSIPEHSACDGVPMVGPYLMGGDSKGAWYDLSDFVAETSPDNMPEKTCNHECKAMDGTFQGFIVHTGTDESVLNRQNVDGVQLEGGCFCTKNRQESSEGTANSVYMSYQYYAKSTQALVEDSFTANLVANRYCDYANVRATEPIANLADSKSISGISGTMTRQQQVENCLNACLNKRAPTRSQDHGWDNLEYDETIKGFFLHNGYNNVENEWIGRCACIKEDPHAIQAKGNACGTHWDSYAIIGQHQCQKGLGVGYNNDAGLEGVCNEGSGTGALGIRVYEGSDNPGSTAADKIQKCYEACRDQKTSLANGPWSSRGPAQGFSIRIDGRCYCNHKKPSTCATLDSASGSYVEEYLAYEMDYDFSRLVGHSKRRVFKREKVKVGQVCDTTTYAMTESGCTVGDEQCNVERCTTRCFGVADHVRGFYVNPTNGECHCTSSRFVDCFYNGRLKDEASFVSYDFMEECDYPWTFKSNGECGGPIPNNELRMFEGDGDNSGSDYVEKCAMACLGQKPSLNGRSWTGFEAKGFVVSADGACSCEGEAWADCPNPIDNAYSRYDFTIQSSNECVIGEICNSFEGVVVDNVGIELDPSVHPMRYGQNSLIFGAQSGSAFRMIKTDMSGMMLETRYIESETVGSMQDLTVAYWDSVPFEKRYRNVYGQTQCVGGYYCVKNARSPAPYNCGVGEGQRVCPPQLDAAGFTAGSVHTKLTGAPGYEVKKWYKATHQLALVPPSGQAADQKPEYWHYGIKLQYCGSDGTGGPYNESTCDTTSVDFYEGGCASNPTPLNNECPMIYSLATAQTKEAEAETHSGDHGDDSGGGYSGDHGDDSGGGYSGDHGEDSGGGYSGGSCNPDACKAVSNMMSCMPPCYWEGSCDCPPGGAAFTCTCSNGSPATGSACTSDGAKCASCNTGYFLSGVACAAYTCTCSNGSPATGSACTSDGAKCASCNTGYFLSGTTCAAYTCTCSNGTPATGSACTSDGAKCASCNNGYGLSGGACAQERYCSMTEMSAIDKCTMGSIDAKYVCKSMGMYYVGADTTALQNLCPAGWKAEGAGVDPKCTLDKVMTTSCDNSGNFCPEGQEPQSGVCTNSGE